MKYVCVSLLLGVFLLSLFSCGGAEEAEEAQVEEVQEEVPQEEVKHPHLQDADEVALNFLEAYKNQNYREIQKYVSPSVRTYYGEHNPDVDDWVTEENIAYLQDWDGEFEDARFTKEYGSGLPTKVYHVQDMEDDEILAMLVARYQDDYDFKEPVWMVTTFAGIEILDKEEFLGFEETMDALE